MPKSAMFKTMVFAQNRQIFDPFEFTRNRPKKSRKELQILLQGFWRRFREFGAISRKCQNRPCSKPWFLLKIGQLLTRSNSTEINPKSRARSYKSFYKGFGSVSESLERLPGHAKIGHVQNHGFCSKSANFRPVPIHPKSTQKVAQGVTNPFTRVLEAFQRVWSDFQDMPKSAMFKIMAIAQGFCSKSANF